MPYAKVFPPWTRIPSKLQKPVHPHLLASYPYIVEPHPSFSPSVDHEINKARMTPAGISSKFIIADQNIFILPIRVALQDRNAVMLRDCNLSQFRISEQQWDHPAWLRKPHLVACNN